MGLDIGNYGYSYSMLQRLRRWATEVEKNPRKLACHDYGLVGYDKECGKCVYCDLAKVTTPEEMGFVTRFYEFINHSDCEGGYINLEKLGLTVVEEDTFRKGLLWGDLGRLKEEVEELDKHKDTLKDHDRQAWEAFAEDVRDADYILRFH